MELTPSYCVVCSGKEVGINCKNPSHKVYYEGFMQNTYVLHNSFTRVTGGMFCINPSWPS